MEDNNISRKDFLCKSALVAAGIVLLPNFISCSDEGIEESLLEGGENLSLDKINFDSGVASFDPTTSQVIIWTRYTTQNDSASIVWEIAANAGFDPIIRTGEVTTDASRDYTLAIEVRDLDPGEKYYYRFINKKDQAVSDTGETITFPLSATAVKLAVCSCANYEAGFFNVYKAMAASDADVIVHLGDYIYENAPGQTGGTPYPEGLGREPDPPRETISLEDYRQRYRQYRADGDLQLAHQKKPFICVWDDHELANGAWENGAMNHNNGEGSFQARKEAAVKAYSEYLPVSTSDPFRIYRTMNLGGIVDLHMIDTRQVGRNRQLEYKNYVNNKGEFDAENFKADLWRSDRTMLGTTQRNWLVSQVQSSSMKWNVLGQQGLMSKVLVPAEAVLSLDSLLAEVAANGQLSAETAQKFKQQLTELILIKTKYLQGGKSLTAEEISRITNIIPYNLDAWDGYPAEREYLYQAFAEKKILSLAGSTHNAWFNKLRKGENEILGDEFATSSISSPGFEGFLGKDPLVIMQFEQALQLLVDDVKFLDASRRGYVEITFTPSDVHADWIFVHDVASKDSSSSTGHSENI
ncbi:MAG: alkaline phosphatase D family protein [Salegentibacter sp.]